MWVGQSALFTTEQSRTKEASKAQPRRGVFGELTLLTQITSPHCSSVPQSKHQGSVSWRFHFIVFLASRNLPYCSNLRDSICIHRVGYMYCIVCTAAEQPSDPRAGRTEMARWPQAATVRVGDTSGQPSFFFCEGRGACRGGAGGYFARLVTDQRRKGSRGEDHSCRKCRYLS